MKFAAQLLLSGKQAMKSHFKSWACEALLSANDEDLHEVFEGLTKQARQRLKGLDVTGDVSRRCGRVIGFELIGPRDAKHGCEA